MQRKVYLIAIKLGMKFYTPPLIGNDGDTSRSQGKKMEKDPKERPENMWVWERVLKDSVKAMSSMDMIHLEIGADILFPFV